MIHSRWRYFGLIVLLGVYVAQVALASPQHSVTFDEQYHLTPGYVYLTQGDLRFHHDQNPPLFEAILAAPLLARSDLHLPIDHPAYQLWGDVYLFSDAFFWHSGNNPDNLVQAGRIMAALTGVLLGLLLFTWGKQLFGEPAGWIALFLFAFDPNFVAHAIPTLDLPLAFTSTLAMFALWHYLKRPSLLTLILTGLALGFALATKFLSIMLLPSFLLVLLIYPHPPLRSIPAGRTTHHAPCATRYSLLVTRYSLLITRSFAFLGMLLVAYFVLWMTYRLQFGPIEGAGLPVPAPQYFESFIGMFFKSSEGRANYLLEQVSTAGWPYYFVIAFLIKTPLPTLIAIIFALIRWPWRREWRTSGVLYIPALLFFIAASISQLQLGYRYLLPVLPFLFLMAGRATQDLLAPRTSLRSAPVELRGANPERTLSEASAEPKWESKDASAKPPRCVAPLWGGTKQSRQVKETALHPSTPQRKDAAPLRTLAPQAVSATMTPAQPRWPKVVVGVLAIWLVISAFVTFPNHLAYFNELAGGPYNGYKYLTDSNVDWGQDLPALKRWIDSQAYQPAQLHLAFFGAAYPDRYGISAIGLPSYPNSAFGREADAFTSYSLDPGQYAISATLLRVGLVSRLFDAYKAFESMTPIAQPAPSILIYDVKYPEEAEVDRAVIVGPLAAEVSPQDLGYRADHPLRAKYCEPDQCFILTPHPARYIVGDPAPSLRGAIPPSAPPTRSVGQGVSGAQQSRRMTTKQSPAPTEIAPHPSTPQRTDAAPLGTLAPQAVSATMTSTHVYEFDATTLIADKLQQLHALPATTPDGITTTFPITFANGLALAGYEINPAKAAERDLSQGFVVNTYWRVTERVQPPVTVFVHLLDAQGNIVAQNDSFGAATRMLEPGDLIVQRHPLTLPADAAPGAYRLQVGLYNPNTLRRFTAYPANAPETDRVLLSTIEIN